MERWLVEHESKVDGRIYWLRSRNPARWTTDANEAEWWWSERYARGIAETLPDCKATAHIFVDAAASADRREG